MAGLAKKRSIRKGHRGSAARVVNQVDEIVGEGEPDLAKLAQLKLSLTEKLETLNRLDQEILELTEEDNISTEIEQADTFKDRIYTSLVKIDRATPTAPPAGARTHPRTSPPGGDERPSTHQVKLPKLSIKPFGGDITQWFSFWDSYDAAIHSNPDLSAVDKFNYLRSYLEPPRT